MPLVIEESKRLGLTPMVGLRVRPVGAVARPMGGQRRRKGKFGLSAAQVLSVISRFVDAGMQTPSV